MAENEKTPPKSFFERLADRVYILLGVIFVSMGVMLGMAWWGSDFYDYMLGSMAVYMLGSGLAVMRLQDFFDLRGGLATRKSRIVALEGLPAQVWALYWIFSFLTVTALGVYLVFNQAWGNDLDLLAAGFTLLGLAGVRLGVYLAINSGRLPAKGLHLPIWAQGLLTLAMLVLFWLVVFAMARTLGLPY